MNHTFFRVSLVCVAALAVTTLRADPVSGANRKEVTDDLGQPTGRLTVGNREVLMYPRGRVTLENGLVTEVSLKNVEVYAAEEARRIAAETLRREAVAKRAAELAANRKAGAEALEKLVNEPRWAGLSADDRLEILARFAKTNPDADVSFELGLATRRRERELAERRRIDELEARVAAAESRAAAAESRAAAAEGRAAEAGAAAQRAESRSTQREVQYVETPVYVTQVVPPVCTVVKPPCVPQPNHPLLPCPPVINRPPVIHQHAQIPCPPAVIQPAPRVTGINGPQWRVTDKGVLVPSTIK